MYTLREFRARTKEAFDKAEENGSVDIKRADKIFVLLYRGNEYPNRPEDTTVEMVEVNAPEEVKEALVAGFSASREFCEHGYGRKLCRDKKCKFYQFRRRH